MVERVEAEVLEEMRLQIELGVVHFVVQVQHQQNSAKKTLYKTTALLLYEFCFVFCPDSFSFIEGQLNSCFKHVYEQIKP